MIYGIGIDTESVNRVEKLLSEHGDYIARIFTAREQRAAKNFPLEKRALFYAAAFAGKEAVMKSLGTGWSEGVEWTEIETPIDDSGAAKLFGASAEYAAKMGISRVVVSLSATPEIVAATAIAEKD